MELCIERVPHTATVYEVTKLLAAQALHTEAFIDRDDPMSRLMNFKVFLEPAGYGVQNKGYGYLVLPTAKAAEKFLRLARDNPIRMNGRKLWFSKSGKKPTKAIIQQLLKAPYVDPDIDEERQRLETVLDEHLRVASVQFGVYHRKTPQSSREFSVEWNKDFLSNGHVAWVKLHYSHKCMRVQLGNKVTDEIGQTIVVRFNTIIRLGYGYDFGNPFVCFELSTPALLEQEEFYRAMTGDDAQDNRNFRHRLVGLDEAHKRIAPYAHQLRMVLVDEPALRTFINLAKVAGLPMPVHCKLEACERGFYTTERLRQVQGVFKQMQWAVAFQLELLLRNRLLTSDELLSDDLWPNIRSLYENNPQAAAEILRSFAEAVRSRASGETPGDCLQRLLLKPRTATTCPSGMFSCYHITFCPSRMILEGPFPTQGNRVIREYSGYEEHFVRVDFREEDGLQYRWDREVDCRSFLAERVGRILKEGFELAGRHFQFLAYSSSALKQHAVWFVHPFEHHEKGSVDAYIIRDRLGDFSGAIDNNNETRDAKTIQLRMQPSKYAARMAQAFTATDPSVRINEDQWQEIPDLGKEPHLHTDGCGTISRKLADMIWAALCKDRPYFQACKSSPDCYQIRFLGYKGIVTVDETLEGEQMCLRPSMNKFRAHKTPSAEIEIAKPFWKPTQVNLNRALIMILEDRGVSWKCFMKLQDEAVRDINTASFSIDNFVRMLSDRGAGLGSNYRLLYIMRNLAELGFDFKQRLRVQPLSHPFILRLVEFIRHHLLREIKHGASIPLRDAYLLPGVADEGPAYEARGHQNVFKLAENRIFACVQGPDDVEPKWLKGNCVIWRSPVVHPGDIQRVYAIGKPPEDQLCFFSRLKNVVVLPSVGERSLASCLGGGDLDGDEYCVSMLPTLLPTEQQPPAEYPPVETLTLDRPAEIDDICDFIVEYVHSDVLGLLSDKHLVIADQSKDGVRDEKCLRLAELCSQAVDYAKNGIAINLAKEKRAMKQLIPFKPDWHAAEIISPRSTDYYESSRALGHLYREIRLTEPEEDYPEAHGVHNAISGALRKTLKRFAKTGLCLSAETEAPDWVAQLYESYVAEMRYICSTHTLLTGNGNPLEEEEVVVSTILAKCSQKRLRKERVFRMKEHNRTLVNDVRHKLWIHPSHADIEEHPDAKTQRLYRSLERAWTAWCLSVRKQHEFGANSFGLIALAIIFDCKEELECLILK
ncbi:RdRP-domain-containing protein [Punctularia strigosozonata HHB-11173 SS5]|uniref:RdRP-domain-containing protein n=1 Tax=Punctularia strigosozonata (strain HHB-11173) TaxID=741275 RepID=UPI0004417FEE|nr:RdRP-domain-containing protein [Punctularia strigosozonata HHB-11173 SS5]EIN07212.1 RdRP-domain-containing protein [Punctularia strigosozonata HHB-11173 SS5]